MLRAMIVDLRMMRTHVRKKVQESIPVSGADVRNVFHHALNDKFSPVTTHLAGMDLVP